jgi:hypothetical protein
MFFHKSILHARPNSLSPGTYFRLFCQFVFYKYIQDSSVHDYSGQYIIDSELFKIVLYMIYSGQYNRLRIIQDIFLLQFSRIMLVYNSY